MLIRAQVSSFPWIVTGDFNEIRYLSVRELGQGEFDVERAKDFNDAIATTNLEEMESPGGGFTWTTYNRTVIGLGRSLTER